MKHCTVKHSSFEAKRHRPLLPLFPTEGDMTAYQQLIESAAAAAAAVAIEATTRSSDRPVSEDVLQAVNALSMMMPYGSKM